MRIRLRHAPAIVGAIALALSGCSSGRGLTAKNAPRCTGNERRPLNADLWDWSAAAPQAAAQSAPIGALGYAPQIAPTALPIEQTAPTADAPDWDIAASFDTCGDTP